MKCPLHIISITCSMLESLCSITYANESTSGGGGSSAPPGTVKTRLKTFNSTGISNFLNIVGLTAMLILFV